QPTATVCIWNATEVATRASQKRVSGPWRRMEEGSSVMRCLAYRARDRGECRDVMEVMGRDALSAVTIVARLRSSSYGGQPTPLEVPCNVWRVAKAGLPAEAPKGRRLVEPRGIEPLTSSLRTRRSPS